MKPIAIAASPVAIPRTNMFLTNMFVRGYRLDEMAIQPSPKSRRERPAKPALSREGIIATALDILKTEGLGRVTMRRVAAALDTGAASLYVYVRDSSDLHAHLLDALIGSLPSTPRAAPRQQLKALLGAYVETLTGYPEMARMAQSTRMSGPNYLALIERILALLAKLGVPDGEAAWGVDLLLLMATARAAELSAWAESGHGDRDFATLATAIRSANAAEHPRIARLAELLLDGSHARADWHLEVILHGMLSARRSSSEHT
ncbi:MAG TPA: TetR/AcrR family transcriptional regulator [Kofleriaceae bacterium]|nr:TetR/AcrR family transcriptional regulator [Kofleriaceae bacterium]